MLNRWLIGFLLVVLMMPAQAQISSPGCGTSSIPCFVNLGTGGLGSAAAPLTVAGKTTTTTATVVTLTAATSAQLIAANATRKGLRWMNIGTNPVTIVPGASAAVVGNGMNYNGSGGTGQQGGSEAFEGTAVPGDAFQAISTNGTTIIVWEQN